MRPSPAALQRHGVHLAARNSYINRNLATVLPKHIKALYYLKLNVGRPMTALVREAVEHDLPKHGGADKLIPRGEI